MSVIWKYLHIYIYVFLYGQTQSPFSGLFFSAR